jgi:hypothetical protein
MFHILNVFLSKLGFDRQISDETHKKTKILGLFKKRESICVYIKRYMDQREIIFLYLKRMCATG